MPSYSPYAVSEDTAPKWRPGEDLACSGFFAVIFYLVIDVNIGIHRAFKRRTGLYFWSMFLGVWAVALNTVGLLLSFFKPEWKRIWPLWTAFINVGWSIYAVAELLVLYSRLHLVNQNHRLQRWLLIYILCASFAIIIPITVLTWGAYDPDPKTSSVWSPRFAIMTRVSQPGFTIVESTISCVYLRSLVTMLKRKLTVRQRRVMRDLVCVNVILISLDVLEVIMVYLNEVGLGYPVQNFSYMLKFKLEFVVLNQLMAVAAKGKRKETFEERRYHHSSEANPTSSAKLSDQKSAFPVEQILDGAHRKEEETSSLSSAALQPPEPILSLQRASRKPPLVSDDDGEELDGERIHMADTLPSPGLNPNSANASGYNIHIQSGPRSSNRTSLIHPFRRSPPERQGSVANDMLPLSAKATWKNPKKESAEDEDDEEEGGFHLWEKNGKFLMEVPWYQAKTMGA
ncbi:hypothetical protein N7G274_004019 [Stereocaulon virgatum]|uniref:DUF7703 domain-containing protein n=1 Tax=Stereocaulon virgatum TaxID=373712 RepID=A0ABR4ADJ3_9LECA